MRALLVALVAAVAVSAGCSKGTNNVTDPGTTRLSMTLTPQDAEAPKGGVISFTAAFSVTGGTPGATGTMSWSSNAPVVTIAPGPFATAMSQNVNFAYCVQTGRAVVTANVQYQQETQSSTATVACDSTVATPKTAPVGGAPVQLTASGTGGTASTTVSNPDLKWTVDNKSIASVTTAGLATPLSPGLATASATLTENGTTYPIVQALMFVTGTGSCSLNANSLVAKTLTFRVQSDPGNHAAQIGFPATGLGPLTFAFGQFASTNMQVSVGGGTGNAPFVSVNGGWVGSTACSFVANGIGTIAGQQNVGVRLEGTWTTGALNLTYTVGTNGELSGGPTVYTVTG
jgi:hypothetical protein